MAGSVKTDKEGRFQITDLVPGSTYKIRVPTSKTLSGRRASLGPGRGHTAKSGETVDLDIMKFRGEMIPNEAMAVALMNRDPVHHRMTESGDEARNPTRCAL